VKHTVKEVCHECSKSSDYKEFAVLPYDDYLKLQEDMEDYEDLRCLREAKESEKEAPTMGLSELKRKLMRRTK
jgi:hypothetical protein